MSFINVAEWTPSHVIQWLQGLEDNILPYVNFFLENQINGCRLLLLNSDDLDKLNVKKIGHQEIILDAIDLLKHLHYSFKTETLQTLALRLGCKSRSLYNQLKKENDCGKCDNCINKPNSELNFDLNDNCFESPFVNENLYKKNFLEKQTKGLCKYVTTSTLSGVCDILISVKQFISWIDKYAFERQEYYNLIRKTILRISIELASTAQRDHFVENAKEIIKSDCFKFAELCDRIVQELNDSLAIQPAILEVVPIKRKQNEELGMNIYSSYSGIHIVGAIKIQSPTHRCGRVEEGDEIIQINYQTVVGWQQNKLVGAMKEYPTEILITIKKKPKHSNIVGQLVVLKPYKIPQRKVCSKQISNFIPNFQGIYPENYYIQKQISSKNYYEHENIINLNQTNKSKDLIQYNNRNFFNQNYENEVLCEQNKNENKQLIEKLSAEKPAKGPVYQMLMKKPKKLRRRATISGSSPTSIYPPIRIEDLVNLDKNEINFFNKKSFNKTSYLNSDDEISNQYENQEQKEFCNPINEINISAMKKTSMINQNFKEFKENFSQLNYINDKIQPNEIFNKQININKSKNKFNNATIINLNKNRKSSSIISNEGINLLSNLCYLNEEPENEINKKLNQKSNENKFANLKLLNNQNKTSENKSKQKNLLNTSKNKQKHHEKISSLDVEEILSNNLLNKKIMNLKINSDFESCQHQKKQQIQFKKNLNISEKKNLFKQTKMNQIYEIADFKGWFTYIKEESVMNKPYKKSSLNSEFNQTLCLNKNFWKDSYLIFKNNLLYFFDNINKTQPYEIIDILTFKLHCKIELFYDKQAFKIENSQYIFYFSSNDINNLKKLVSEFQNNSVFFTYKTNFNSNESNLKEYKPICSNKNFFKHNDNTSNLKNFPNLNTNYSTQIFLPKINSNDKFNKNYKQKINYSNKKNLFVRSISCLDSDLINQTKERTNFNEIKNYKYFQSFQNKEKPEFKKTLQLSNDDFMQLKIDSYSDNTFKQYDNQENVNNNLIKKQIPKPQRRISKMKEQSPNFVGKMVNSFDELSKQCEKELEQFSSLKKKFNNSTSELSKLNLVYNSFPRNTILKWDAKKKNSCLNFNKQNYESVLDQEYNKLFGDEPFSKTLNFSKENFFKNYKLSNNIKEDNLNYRCISPNSDYSLSSSSGISSYYSMNQYTNNFNNQKLSKNFYKKNLNNIKKENSFSFNNNFLSSNTKDSNFSSFKLSNESNISKDCNYSLNESPKVNNKNLKIEKQKSLHRKSSFKLFGSSKVLSRINSLSNNLEEKSINKNKFFLYSPILKKTFFGLKRNSQNNDLDEKLSKKNNSKFKLNENKNTCSISVQTDECSLNRTRSESLGILDNFNCNDYFENCQQSFKQQSLRLKSNNLNLDNRYLNSQIDFRITPETPRKPKMGVSMLSKKRTSFINTDKEAIETALLINNDKIIKMRKNLESK